ncbi:hypothetical protein [Marinicrinis sediminis]|uniref:DUF1795 domain-containing protein n=1 Tax=Marinicrinis sediminis TaxID=1652465 RepID=A0ABW5R7V4_9BACL
MKRGFLFVLMVMLVFTAVACGSNENETNTNTANKQEETENNAGTNADEDASANEEDGTANAPADFEGNVFTTADNKAEIKLPSDWEEAPVQQNVLAALEAGNPDEEKYVMIINESKENVSIPLEKYTEIILMQSENMVENATTSEPSEIDLGGYPALRYEVSGEIQGMNATYLLNIVETEQDFAQIIFWSESDRFQDHKEEFMAIASTFTALEYDPNAQGTGENVTLETVEQDGLAIDIPSNWQNNPSLNPDAAMGYQSMNGFMIVIKEPIEDFEGNLTELDEYYSLVRDSFYSGMDISEKETTTINGNEAILHQMSGEVSGMNLSYVAAMVKTDTHFYQILTWTSSNQFAGQKDVFYDIINSFKEI